MFKKTKPFFIKVITPLHAGSGQDLGIVDLPIQRERHTGFPKIEASGLKGSIREAFEDIKNHREKIENLQMIYPDIMSDWIIEKDGKKIVNEDNNGKKLTKFDQAIFLLFGPENVDSDHSHAGALGFIDARILLFPVKSAKGVFAWITCPKVLTRFKEDMELAGEFFEHYESLTLDDGECLASDNSKVLINESVILEEYAFKKKGNIKDELASELVDFTQIDKSQLLILSDNDFTDFINFSTEVITRTRIDNETGIVQSGALFTEEYLPSETVMYSIALANPIFNKDKGIFNKQDMPEEEQVLKFWVENMPEVMQIGGNATIGKGLVEIIGLEEANNEKNK